MADPLRIGIDYTAAARQRAGIGRYTRELVSALLALPSLHRYTLFAATGGLSDPVEWQRRPNARLRQLPLSDDWLARLWHRLRLPIPVEWVTGRVDVFYSPDFVLPPTRRATRTLLTVHDLSFLRYPEAFVPSLRAYLERVVPQAIARADLVLADSAHTREDIVSLLDTDPDKVRVLYSGVDARFRPEPEPGERERLQERYGIDRRPYVLSVGTVQPRKNYVRLIRALAQMADPAQLQLLIAGGRGWLVEEIVAEAEKHGDWVRLLGFVEDGDLPALYRQSSLLAFPSLYEGFGLPVLEAMACGVPVVCSNVSSVPEVAGDAAVLVDPLDTGALAWALEQVLTKGELRSRMVVSGLEQAARFSWAQAAGQLLAALEAVGAA